jgi:hypothetical protein
VLVSTPSHFEKMYLTPEQAVAGKLRPTFGNPTPIALVGFLLDCMMLAAARRGGKSIPQVFYLGVHNSPIGTTSKLHGVPPSSMALPL